MGAREKVISPRRRDTGSPQMLRLSTFSVFGGLVLYPLGFTCISDVLTFTISFAPESSSLMFWCSVAKTKVIMDPYSRGSPASTVGKMKKSGLRSDWNLKGRAASGLSTKRWMVLPKTGGLLRVSPPCSTPAEFLSGNTMDSVLQCSSRIKSRMVIVDDKCFLKELESQTTRVMSLFRLSDDRTSVKDTFALSSFSQFVWNPR
mmetsp:Transcript_50928/g.115757  ORF Transcript_50928/g.115757 Transcript_50928/m.115757 type:complete len:203 (-) Transcript_50928:2468-3076(-)